MGGGAEMHPQHFSEVASVFPSPNFWAGAVKKRPFLSPRLGTPQIFGFCPYTPAFFLENMHLESEILVIKIYQNFDVHKVETITLRTRDTTSILFI
jgi:hypothetical protein